MLYSTKQGKLDNFVNGQAVPYKGKVVSGKKLSQEGTITDRNVRNALQEFKVATYIVTLYYWSAPQFVSQFE